MYLRIRSSHSRYIAAVWRSLFYKYQLTCISVNRIMQHPNLAYYLILLCQCYSTRKYFLVRIEEGNPAGPGTLVQTPQNPRANPLQTTCVPTQAATQQCRREDGSRYTIYRVSQEECARFREGVPYVKVYRYNPKHLYPKLNGYGDNGQRKVWSFCGSTHYACQLTILSISVLECGVI